jgi:hypothetical protein
MALTTTNDAAAAKEGLPASAGVDDAVLAGALDEIEAGGEDLGAPLPKTDATDPTSEPEVVDQQIAEVVAETPVGEETPAESAVDPLADTSPLDYGQGKAFDGVLVDKTNGGAFILPDKLDAVRAKLIEGDTYREQAQQLHERVQRFESLGGVEGYAKLKGEVEANGAAGLFLMKTLAEAFPGRENAAALKNIFERAEFLMQKSAFDTTNKFMGEQRQFVSQATQGQQEATWFANTVSAIQRALPTLTTTDVEAGKQFFAKRPQLLYHNASVQEAQQYGVKVGERIGDPTAMNEWYSERAALRAEQAKEQTARATAASTANKHNAAMDKGRQPANTGKRAQKPATPAATIPEKVSRREAWTDPLTTALQEMGID